MPSKEFASITFSAKDWFLYRLANYHIASLQLILDLLRPMIIAGARFSWMLWIHWIYKLGLPSCHIIYKLRTPYR